MDAPSNEKKATAGSPPVAVTTTQIHEKSSQESMTTRTLSGSNEHGAGRCSDVSTPTSATACANPFDTDIEAMAMHPTDTRELSQPQTRQGLVRSSTNLPRGDGSNEHCQVWPGRGHWKKQAKAKKRKNAGSCNCLSSLSPRNRMIVKILIGLFIICLGVGVGLGVSRSLNARIWTGNSQ